MAKAAHWPDTDAEARKRGEQTGLDTLVVHAVNDECQPLVGLLTSGAANALSIPPGVYGPRLKLKGIDGGPHKRWSMWFNSTTRRTLPALDIPVADSRDGVLQFGWTGDRCCMAVVSSCREMLG